MPPEPGRSLLAVGSDRGGAPVVRMFDPETGELRWWFQAYSDAVQSGVRVAVGDVTGDGVRDVVTVPASGAAAHVRIFSGVDGSDAGGFFAFEPEFNGGASVAVGDLDQDGKGEIVVGAGAGGAPRVRVFRGGDFAPIRDFFAYESAARGGVNVAVGDLGGELGQAIVTGPGEGGGPLVKVFHLHGEEPLRAFFAGDPATTQGAGVAAGDLDGDGGDELVVGSGTGPEVRIIDPRLAAERAAFRAGDRESHRGARIAVVPRVGDRGGLIALGSGPGELPAIRLFVPSGAVQRVLDPGADAVIRPGVFVAG